PPATRLYTPSLHDALPISLIAMLRTVAYSWKQAALAENAKQVADLGRELYQRLGTMGGHVDKLGRALQSSVKAYNQTLGSLEGRVFVTARKLNDLDVTNDELDAPDMIDTQPRQVTAEELVADATQATPMIGRDRTSLPEAEQLTRSDPEDRKSVV